MVIVYVLLHVILFFVERYRYTHGHWSWYGFKENGMLGITYAVWFIDMLLITIGGVSVVGYWILQPAM